MKKLNDVYIVRFVAIVLIVIVHALAIYSRAWQMPEGVANVPLYSFLSKFFVRFSLPAFVMIGGYVFGYQMIAQKREYTLLQMVKIKAKRLYIPSLLFSFLYLILFTPFDLLFSFDNFISVLSGRGHLWFLPMLFWCYIFHLLMYNKILKKYEETAPLRVNISLVALSLMISFIPISIPFGLSHFFDYYFFFVFGYLLFCYKDNILPFLMRRLSVCLSVCLYILLFIISGEINAYIIEIDHFTFLGKCLKIMFLRIDKILLGVTGILMLWTLANLYLQNTGNIISEKVIKLLALSYGIYVYHQFVLKFIYYYTDIPQLINYYILPWVAFVLTLLISFFLTKLTLMTRIGRKLL